MSILNRFARTTLVVGLAVLLAGCSGVTAPATTTVGTGTASAAPTSQPFPADTAAAIAKAASDTMTRGNIPGAIVMVQTPAGRFEQAFGVSDTATGAALGVDEYMRIGSITKTMTITVLLQLVDKGEVTLDTPARTYLPDLPETWKDVTVRQLANMRSGVPSYSNTQDFGQQLVADPQRQFTSAELLAFVEGLPVNFAPGTSFDYSNTNTVILGLIVEKITGASLADALQAMYDQAGLKDTDYAEAVADFPSPHPQGYTQLTGPVTDATDWNASWGQAAGAAVSTESDLELWMKELSSGSLLTADTQKQRLDLVNIPGNPAGTGYGLGIAETNGWLGHSGDLPGYSATMYALADGSTIIVLVNTDSNVARADGTLISPSAAVAEAVTAITTPATPFVFPHVT